MSHRSFYRSLPLRGKILYLLDSHSHRKPWEIITCDAWDLYVGMTVEDIEWSGRRVSRASKWLAGV